MDYKAKFEEIYLQNITRDGSKELLEWIKTTDFFTTPASTKYHCACEGGLTMHSINVYETFMEKHFDEKTETRESVAISSLLHDICKVHFYKTSTRNVKNEETGMWEKQPYYMVEDAFPYGHGEKSVFLIERFMRLKTSEAMAIRWHMGGFDDSVKAGSFSLSLAFEKYPIVVKLHLSDLESTYIREKNTSAVSR